MNDTQKRVIKVLDRIMWATGKDEDIAETYSDLLEEILARFVCEDTFGSEGENDPRGDQRDGDWSMKRVQGFDK